MTTRPTTTFLEQLRRHILARDEAALTDGQLLERYLVRREEAAFAVLVERHGPMVWGVCRRVLGDGHDAEDAFQATFLVLVRKAAAVRPREKVANWLYGVACMTARRARVAAARRWARERPMAQPPEPEAVRQEPHGDVQPLLDEELSRLPDKYRAAIVLCELEGKTRSQAARELGCPEGTVAGRLARARVLLARRLARRGVALSGAALAAALSRPTASAAPPAPLRTSTIKTAALVAARRAAAGLIPSEVAALTEEVLKAMLLHKLKTVTTFLALLGAATLGGAVLAWGNADEAGARPVPAQARPAEKGKPAAPAPQAQDDRIRPGDRLRIHVTDTPPGRPIQGVFRVEPSGAVALGAGYGRVSLQGLTPEQAEAVLRGELGKVLKAFEVSVTRYDPPSDERLDALERRCQQLEEELRTLRATVQQLQGEKGK